MTDATGRTGLVWVCRLEGRPKIVDGSSHGSFRLLARYPDDNISVALMTNLGRAPYTLQVLEGWMVRLLLHVKEPLFEEVPLPEKERTRYFGSYQAGAFGFGVEPVGDGIALNSTHPERADDSGSTCFRVGLRYLGDGASSAPTIPTGWKSPSKQVRVALAR